MSLHQHSYVRLTLASLWGNLPLVLLAGFVFSLLCAPALLLASYSLLGPAVVVGALTVAPGWAALLAQEVDIGRDVRTSIAVMLRALPRYWIRGAGLGLLAAFPLLAALATLPGLALPSVPGVVWLGLLGDLVGVAILTVLFLYAFPLVVLHDMGVRTALRNALVLASSHVANTLGLLGMGVLFAFATFYVSSFLAFVLPAVWGLFIVNNCRMVVAAEWAAPGQDAR